MTAVVIASSSIPRPRRMSAEKKVMLWIVASTEAENAVNANSEILTRATGTPRLRAAVADPPAPAIQLPKRVRPRMYVPMTAMSSHHRIETLKAAPPPTGRLQLNKPAIGSAATTARSIGM